jgi:hypothetical protein
VGLKATGGNSKARVLESLSEALIKHIGLGGRRGIRKRRPVAFTTVPVEGKLRNHEEFAFNVDDRSIHFTLIVRENTETRDLVGQRFRVSLGVVFSDSQKNAKAQADVTHKLTLRSYTRFDHSLYYRAHVKSVHSHNHEKGWYAKNPRVRSRIHSCLTVNKERGW